MPTAAAMSMSGRESKDVAAEIVSGIDVLGLTGPLKVRPHAYEIGPIVAADNGSGRRGGTPNSLPAYATVIVSQPRKKGHFTKRSGNSKFTRSPGIPGGTGGKGCARCNSASASSSSALAPDERTMRLSI